MPVGMPASKYSTARCLVVFWCPHLLPWGLAIKGGNVSMHLAFYTHSLQHSKSAQQCYKEWPGNSLGWITSTEALLLRDANTNEVECLWWSYSKCYQSKQEWIRPAQIFFFFRIFSAKCVFLVKISTPGRTFFFIDTLSLSIEIIISIFLELVCVFKILLGKC